LIRNKRKIDFGKYSKDSVKFDAISRKILIKGSIKNKEGDSKDFRI
jgi:hypothetical protein